MVFSQRPRRTCKTRKYDPSEAFSVSYYAVCYIFINIYGFINNILTCLIFIGWLQDKEMRQALALSLGKSSSYRCKKKEKGLFKETKPLDSKKQTQLLENYPKPSKDNISANQRANYASVLKTDQINHASIRKKRRRNTSSVKYSLVDSKTFSVGQLKDFSASEMDSAATVKENWREDGININNSNVMNTIVQKRKNYTKESSMVCSTDHKFAKRGFRESGSNSGYPGKTKSRRKGFIAPTNLIGVELIVDRGRYKSVLHYEDEKYHIGEFDTELAAACAYDHAALCIIGGKVHTNYDWQIPPGVQFGSCKKLGHKVIRTEYIKRLVKKPKKSFVPMKD